MLVQSDDPPVATPTKNMTKLAAALALICFFGILRIAYPDQSSLVQENAETANVNQGLTNVKQNERRLNFPRQELPAAAAATAADASAAGLVPPGNRYNLVKCYACTNCEKTYSYTPAKLCPYTPDTSKQGKCVAYTEKYLQSNEALYVRGCASERGSCADIRRAYQNTGKFVDLLSCSECEGDVCNGATKSMSVTAVITLTVLPILGKITFA